MKLEFALDLSHDGIRLLHLTAEGEPVLAEVALDDPDFDSAVAEMRRMAEARAVGPLRTELLIPESEILYTTIDAPGPDRASRDRTVREGLEGMTPYSLEDLVFDWRGAGETALVAAVARDTLAEAEAFATTHGFNPMRFSARPRPGAFRGRPKFGDTSHADSQAMGAPQADPAPSPDSTAAPAAAPLTAGLDADDPVKAAAVTDPALQDTPGTAAGPEGSDTPSPAGGTVSDSADAAEPAAPGEPESPSEEAVAQSTPSVPLREDANGAAPAAPDALDDAKRDSSSAAADPLPAAEAGSDSDAFAAARTGAAQDRPAPRQDAEARDTAPAPGPKAKPAGPEPLDDVPDMPAVHALNRPSAPLIPPAPPRADAARTSEAGSTFEDDDTSAAIAFMSRRTGTPPTDVIPPMPNQTRLGNIASRIALMPDRPEPKPVPPGRRAQPPAPTPPGRVPLKASPAPKPAPAAKANRTIPPAPIAPTAPGELPDSRLAEATLTPVSDEGGRILGPSVRASLSNRMASGRKLDEAEALTVFGARGQQADRPGLAKLLLGGLAAAAVFAVAAWGGLALLSDDTGSDVGLPAEDIALVAPEGGPDADTGDEIDDSGPIDVIPPGPGVPGESDIAPLPGQTASQTADSLPETTPQVTDAPTGAPPVPATAEDAPLRSATDSPVAVANAPDRAAAPAPDAAPGTPQAAPALPAPLTPEAALSRYASTGIWQLAPEPSKPPAADRIEDVYRAALDPEVAMAQASDLPELPTAEPDAPSSVVTLPPTAAGTDFAFDSRGLVKATPQGALSPEGIRVVAGRPPITPPARPEPPAGFLDSVTPEQPATPEPPFRPMPRPQSAVDETSVTEAPQPASDATADSGPSQADLLRPPSRPQSLSQARDQAIAAAVASVAASTAATQESGAAAAGANPEAAEDAVTAAVDAPQPERISPYAVASAPLPVRRPDSLAKTVAAVRAARSAPVATAPARAQPSGPTPGSVARQATLGNAIDLGRMSLIGTYGSEANRRALVRLGSGRFVKVKVGDRVEGGQIAGIGDGALRYRKGGRDITLKVPSG